MFGWSSCVVGRYWLGLSDKAGDSPHSNCIFYINMKTQQEIEQMIINAIECDDGHFYDRSECHYCGIIDGIQIALMWVLGAADLYRESKDDGSRDTLRSHLSSEDTIKFYRAYSSSHDRK